MKYYKFTYYDDYRGLYLPLKSDVGIVLDSYKGHYKKTSHILTYDWIPYIEDKGEKFADFPNPFSQFFLLSKRAWNLLGNIIIDDVIFIEVSSPDDNYYALQVLHGVECFDPDNSDYVYFASDPTKKARVKTLALEIAKVPNAQIFRVDADWGLLPGIRGSLIVSQNFVDIVTQNNFTGGFFEEVRLV